MCGIVGVLNLKDAPAVEKDVLLGMLSAIHHRGPDGVGVYRDAIVGLGSARLSIIDLAGGWQPIGNEDQTLWIVYNGEIFNYIELRRELEARGHRFATQSDTEVILHLYEDHGPACLNRLNGQFALAIWDARKQALFLARDRLGIRPLYYTLNHGRLVFGSEIKALLACPGVSASLDPVALSQVFTFWSTIAPRTAFQDILELPPAHYLLVADGKLAVQRYWALDFTEGPGGRTTPEYLEEFGCLLADATRIRLRADVDVGAYLSGGLDSSVIAALAQQCVGQRLNTYSIAFDDPDYDESAFQRVMAAHLGTNHRVIRCSHADIGNAFPEVTWHAEMPVLRTAPVPMYLLSGLVQACGLKVVLTGEGADELLAGYDIFKEMKIRRFWARNPSSRIRPLLFQRIYRDIPGLQRTSPAFLTAFFAHALDETDSPYYSHLIRWTNTARIRCFLADGLAGDPRQPLDFADVLPLPPAFRTWTPLAQAQYLESTTFLSEYLLSAQGDRVAMGHSIEGRFPFLDYRIVEFCMHLPSDIKLKGLHDKWLLRQLGCGILPQTVWQRPKRPYRAPIHLSFFGQQSPGYVQELLSPEALRQSGLFDEGAVGRLVHKATAIKQLGEVDEMALVGILSTQLLHHQFVQGHHVTPSLSHGPTRVVDFTDGQRTGTTDR